MEKLWLLRHDYDGCPGYVCEQLICCTEEQGRKYLEAEIMSEKPGYGPYVSLIELEIIKQEGESWAGKLPKKKRPHSWYKYDKEENGHEVKAFTRDVGVGDFVNPVGFLMPDSQYGDTYTNFWAANEGDWPKDKSQYIIAKAIHQYIADKNTKRVKDARNPH